MLHAVLAGEFECSLEKIMTFKLALIILLIFPFTVYAEQQVPEGFIAQVLEPTGGKIIRPKDWFYTESHRGSSYTWILSKEDASKGPYDTGVRIQTLIGVEEGTGKSPENFILDFIGQKKKESQIIHKECEPQDQGFFTRICLEVDEGDYRILYSMFWGNDMDIVVVSIAGAKKEDWPSYENTFNKMSAFELIDMKRFEQK